MPPRRPAGCAAFPAIGPKIEAQILEALARESEPRPQRALLLNQAQELVGGIAEHLGGEVAGDVRRWRDACERLAVVCAVAEPSPCWSGSPRCRRSSR